MPAVGDGVNDSLTPEVQSLLDRWVHAVESKDLEELAGVFHRGPDLAVFWSNGERNLGWDEVRNHIESDFLKNVDLIMKVQDPRWVPQGSEAGVLIYRYRITLRVSGDSLAFERLATMSLHRETVGWRVAALHVSNAPGDEPSPA